MVKKFLMSLNDIDWFYTEDIKFIFSALLRKNSGHRAKFLHKKSDRKFNHFLYVR